MGQEKTKCKDVIAKCDQALTYKNKELQLADLAIKSCQDRNSSLLTEVEDSRDKLESPIRNPFVVGIIGFLSGALIYGIIRK